MQRSSGQFFNPAKPDEKDRPKYPKMDELGELLLTHVVWGKQNEAEALLKKNPELLLQKGNVTDPSDRKFFEITALQYALWALDKHMYHMLFSYFTDKSKATEQSQELETHGIKYSLSESKSEVRCEKHFDFTTIIGSLVTYLTMKNIWDYHQTNHYWGTVVGGAQHNLPMHVVNEYCHPSRSFKPIPDFKEETLPRCSTYHVERHSVGIPTGEYRKVSWFSKNYGEILGDNFAFIRSFFSREILRTYQGGDRQDVLNDLEALKTLYQVRTKDLQIFNKMLLTITPESASGLKLE